MKVFKKDQWQIMLQMATAVLLFRFVLFQHTINPLGLTHFYFFLFFLATALIFSAGLLLYRIVIQEETPKATVSTTSEKAYYQYLGLNMLGIGISFFVASAMNKTYYFGFFLGMAAILYLYITQWRKIIVFNHVVFAFIITLPLYLEIFTDVLPALDKGDALQKINAEVLVVSTQIAVVLWLLYFIKAIVIDLKFMPQDLEQQKKTLPTLHGRRVGALRTSYLSLLPLLLILLFCIMHFNTYRFLVSYLIIFIVLPYLFYLWTLRRSESTSDFNRAAHILSAIIWLTIFSVVILYFNFQ